MNNLIISGILFSLSFLYYRRNLKNNLRITYKEIKEKCTCKNCNNEQSLYIENLCEGNIRSDFTFNSLFINPIYSNKFINQLVLSKGK